MQLSHTTQAAFGPYPRATQSASFVQTWQVESVRELQKLALPVVRLHPPVPCVPHAMVEPVQKSCPGWQPPAS